MSASLGSKAGNGRSSTRFVKTASGSSAPESRSKKTKEKWVSYTADDIRTMKSQTNWDRLDNLTNEDIKRSIASDPDWDGLQDIDWSKAEWVIPEPKTAISIRLDVDVLAFFKAGGAGYQSRINAVLRSYMKASRKG